MTKYALAYVLFALWCFVIGVVMSPHIFMWLLFVGCGLSNLTWAVVAQYDANKEAGAHACKLVVIE